MPGLVGLVTRMPREVAEAQLGKMVDAICHESFYDRGMWADEAAGVYVGWALRKHSQRSDLPVTNGKGDIVLAFSGEEFSKSDLAPSVGMPPNDDGYSYLAETYATDPDGFLNRLNGMFHGLLLDRRRGTATLFNDRYGMHRLYWHQSKTGFYFAVEAKAILAVLPELRTPDPQGLGEFAACSCVLENRTIFKGIEILPGGTACVFRGGILESRKRYFDPKEWEGQPRLDWQAYGRELKSAFGRLLPEYFKASERVGMTLTGGLDTRLIMAFHQGEPGTLPCYTFGGMFRDCTDVRVARRLAELVKQSHEVITVGDEFLSRFPYYADRSIYVTEGGVDVYRASDLYVSERARQIAPIKIVGTYGSEIVRQAVMFKAVSLMPGLFRSDFVSYVEQAKETYKRVRDLHPVTFAAFRQSPWYHYGILSLEQTQLTVRSPYLDNEFVRTVFRAPSHDGSGEDVRLRMISEESPALGALRTDRGLGGNSNALITAAVHAFQEFTFKAEYAYDYGMPQWVSRVDHFLSPLRLQRLFLGRHKLLHFRAWYRDQLASYVKEMLLDSRTLNRPYLNKACVEGIVKGHLTGGLNYTTAIHKLLTMEILHRRFFDPQ